MSAIMAPAPRGDFKAALTLGLAGALAVFAVLPYALSLLPPQATAHLPPLPIVYLAQGAQGAVVYTLMAWAGLAVGRRVGLGAPWLTARIGRLPMPTQAFPWRLAVAAGALACAIVLLLNFAAQSWLPSAPNGVPSPTPLQGFFASFYGGIGEELQLRLFLMTLVVWVLLKAGLGRAAALLAANAVAALLFGAGHLPMAAQIWPLTFSVVAYVVAANASAGLIFGALYARHGLEAAIVAHFTADIGLHVIAPLVGSV